MTAAGRLPPIVLDRELVSAGFAAGAPLRTGAGNGYALHIVLVIINVIEVQVE